MIRHDVFEWESLCYDVSMFIQMQHERKIFFDMWSKYLKIRWTWKLSLFSHLLTQWRIVIIKWFKKNIFFTQIICLLQINSIFVNINGTFRKESLLVRFNISSEEVLTRLTEWSLEFSFFVRMISKFTSKSAILIILVVVVLLALNAQGKCNSKYSICATNLRTGEYHSFRSECHMFLQNRYGDSEFW